ncbi:hypothetical protein O181_019801 [Austropuccinia psidii MF-1]|uniref:Uncharacterized protein n=1 Tax=Austropuccinia psidii MF-1 TaxID=1389203 RepID=A0A9Q3GU85_9BASI|nr:hypothetical protein [Austropuccinia psidii MF-1]
MPQSLEHLRACWPKANEAIRGQGGSPSAPKAKWVPNHKEAHPSQFFAPKPNRPKMAKNQLRTQIGQEPQNGHKSVHGLWQPPEAIISAQNKDSPPVQGNTFPSSIHPILKDPGVVHI